MPIIEVGKIIGQVDLKRRIKLEFPSSHIKFEVPVRESGRDIEQAVGSASS